MEQAGRVSQTWSAANLPGHASRRAIAGCVKQDNFGRGGTSNLRQRNLEGEAFVATVAHSILRVIGFLMESVVKGHLDPLQQRQRIATVHGNREPPLGSSGGRFKNLRRRVINDQIIRFKCGAQPLRREQRRLEEAEEGSARALFRRYTNRKERLELRRVFVQGAWRRPGAALAGAGGFVG